jgi:hypothetical protein
MAISYGDLTRDAAPAEAATDPVGRGLTPQQAIDLTARPGR